MQIYYVFRLLFPLYVSCIYPVSMHMYIHVYAVRCISQLKFANMIHTYTHKYTKDLFHQKFEC